MTLGPETSHIWMDVKNKAAGLCSQNMSLPSAGLRNVLRAISVAEICFAALAGHNALAVLLAIQQRKLSQVELAINAARRSCLLFA